MHSLDVFLYLLTCICRISYLEIYNETMFDLLSTINPPGARTDNAIPELTPMTVVEDEHGCYVKGLSCHLAQNEEEALNLLFEVKSYLDLCYLHVNLHSLVPFIKCFLVFLCALCYPA